MALSKITEFETKHVHFGKVLIHTIHIQFTINHIPVTISVTSFTPHSHIRKVLEGMDIFRQRSFGSSAARYTFTRFTDTI